MPNNESAHKPRVRKISLSKLAMQASPNKNKNQSKNKCARLEKGRFGHMCMVKLDNTFTMNWESNITLNIQWWKIEMCAYLNKSLFGFNYCEGI